ncbi:MAG: hypothetical protein OJF50_005126 [Nitrospira sp.]|nr:hypothetical protein [Nitrospira sp.]
MIITSRPDQRSDHPWHRSNSVEQENFLYRDACGIKTTPFRRLNGIKPRPRSRFHEGRRFQVLSSLSARYPHRRVPSTTCSLVGSDGESATDTGCRWRHHICGVRGANSLVNLRNTQMQISEAQGSSSGIAERSGHNGSLKSQVKDCMHRTTCGPPA